MLQVQELVPLGSLLDYLIDQSYEASLENDLKLWAGQVAAGRAAAADKLSEISCPQCS